MADERSRVLERKRLGGNAQDIPGALQNNQLSRNEGS